MPTAISSVLFRTRIGAAALALLAVAACDTVPVATGPSNSGGSVQVALLVPSGSGNPGDETLALGLENAARLAIQDLPDTISVDLRVYPTAGNPAQAEAAAQTAVSDGAGIILGPLYAQSANAVGSAVQGRGVNVLAFSNNTDIAGGNVFVLGPTFQNTASRVVGYAQSQGRGTIALAYARSTAGQVAAQAVEGAAERSGATIVTRTSYELNQEAVIGAAPAVADAALNAGATAVFLTADVGDELQLLGQLIPEQGLDTEAVKFLGLTRWDVDAGALGIPGLQGGWFAMPDPALQAGFSSRYSAAFGSAPLPVAGLAYDGIAAIGALVGPGQSGKLTAEALTQSQGFAGVSGVFRLLPDGTNQRALAMAEIQQNQVVVIDPAPRSFGSGF